jgi:uncharacterized protein
MQINVSQLLKEPIGATRDYKVSEIVDITGAGRMVQGEVKLLRTHRGILVKGVLHTEVELICGRCLSPFSCPATLNIDEEYTPTVDVVSGVPLSSPEEPGSFIIDEHHVIDLTEAIRQYLLLAIPMKPLCREDCAGLCSNCGHNLNQGPCGCPVKQVAPRWSELSKLL